MGVLSWVGLVTPKFSVPPSGETMRHTPKRFRGARTCSRSSITMPSFVGLGYHPPLGQPKRLSFLFVCLSVCSSRFWTSEIVVHPISPWRHWSTETILIPLDRGRFVVVHPCSTFSDCCQLAMPLNAEVQKTAKIAAGFAAPQRWLRFLVVLLISSTYFCKNIFHIPCSRLHTAVYDWAVFAELQSNCMMYLDACDMALQVSKSVHL